MTRLEVDRLPKEPELNSPKPRATLIRAVSTVVFTPIKWSGAVIALLALVFGVYQFYQSNMDKKIERATTQIVRFQTFASSNMASEIARQSENNDRKTYDLRKFSDSSSLQFRALLNFFNLLEGISFLYNVGAIDSEYTMHNLLCVVVKQYRTFVLAETGTHDRVTNKLNGGGVFHKGNFENLDKVYKEWNTKSFSGMAVDNRCAANWSV